MSGGMRNSGLINCPDRLGGDLLIIIFAMMDGVITKYYHNISVSQNLRPAHYADHCKHTEF